MSRLRLGFVGAGAISLRLMPHFLVPDVAARVDVTAVCDPVLARAQAAAQGHSSTTAAYASLTEMLASEEVDVVSIGSPIGLHYSHALESVQAGKHVHVNKTMTTTVAEADHLISEMERVGVRIVASPGEMLRPHNQEIRRLIKSGAIGDVTWAVCGAALGRYHEEEPERQGGDPVTNVDPSWYFRVPGGGPLYDLTVYPLHGLTGVLGPVRRVTSMSGTRIPFRTVNQERLTVQAHDSTLILLDFGENLFALAYGTAAGNLTPDVEFDFSPDYFGSSGEIRGLNLNGRPFDYPGRDIAAQAPDQGKYANFGGNEWLLPHITHPHRHLAELHVFEDLMQLVDWVLDEKPSVVTPQHARHVVDIIESSYRAAATGETQMLLTSF